MTLPPPTSTLFPYTTLFRSSSSPESLRTAACLKTVSNRTSIPSSRVATQLKIGGTQAWSLVGANVDMDRRSATRRLAPSRSEEHTSELQSRQYLVCRLLLEK